MVSYNLVEHINGGAFVPQIGDMGYQRVVTPSRRPFPTKDGFVCILPYSDRHWLKFFTAVGRPELMDDPRFCSYLARVHTIDDLYTFVGEETTKRTTEEWLELCGDAEIPCMPIIDIDDLMEDEHLKAVGMFEKHTHPTEGETVLVRPPVKYSKSPGGIRLHAPRFGENGPEVLREVGYDAAAIDALLTGGALLSDPEAD